MKFIDLNYKQFKTTDIARCLTARYTAAPTNYACENSGVIIGGENVEVRAVLTPDREEKRQNGRRIKDDGEPMFTLTAQDRHGVAIVDDLFKNRDIRIYKDYCPTLRHCHTDFKVIDSYNRREIDNKAIGTLTAHGNSNSTSAGTFLIAERCKIRRLTPKECWRLQGFPDSYFDKAKAAGISDSQLYKMAGNAVTVNVAFAIGKKLKEIENE